uniref:uncharacterized protein LOC122596423 n=1 Tax=Erigeron canadensis TaxID=72917 RepID=UPI001CB8D7E0|nr:uncharacterized protein LOC122596423 [Erigeron canadensis]
MESAIRSRKRKHSSSKSDHFRGVFTRSKSLIHIHRHRSGYARPDSNRSRSLIHSLVAKQQQSVDAVNTNQGSVKDLRARRVFSPTDNDVVVSIGDVVLEDVDCKNIDDANPNFSDLGVSDKDGQSDEIGFEAEKVEQNKDVDEKIGMVSKGSVSKSQPTVQSLKGRRKVFKSPSSFSYRRLLPYLEDLGNDDSSSFEIVEAKLSEQAQNSNTVATKDQDIGGAFTKAKSCEKQYSNGGNPDITTTVENSDLVQKNNEDVINDALEESEQMTPPDSDVYSKSKVDKLLDVHAKPASKPVLRPYSRMTLLQTPTSFSHRRLLPFLMSVAGDNSCAPKDGQSLILEKASDRNQQQPSLSTHHNINTDESNTNDTSGQMSTADQKSDSPTSTLIPIDTPFDIVNTVAPVSNYNGLDIQGAEKESIGSTLRMEVNTQAKQIDSSIKMEQSSPKNKLKSVEESSTVIETLPGILTEQSINNNDDLTRLRSNHSGDNQTPVTVSVQHSLLPITPQSAPRIIGEIIKTGILKRTPRGCRGICNCLNCMSFRLHAERSFEFSRNQMNDAEEVALELINDLTCLRKILESTANGSVSLATEKEQQVKEACEKALYKEAVAKAKLAQMNEDLSVHCRSVSLTRPKVTFANKVEEKVYSKEVVYGKKGVSK